MRVISIGTKGTAADLEAIILGKLGMYSGAYIAQRTGLSVGQVYARLKAFGINLRDIRNHGNEFNNQVADLARNQAVASIADIKAVIIKMLPPPKQPEHETARQ